MILYGANEDLCKWVSKGILGNEGLYDEESKAIGHVIDGKLVAAVVYNNFQARPDGTFYNVEMGVYSIDKRWATRHYLKAVFEYPFIQLGLERVQTACSAQNEGVVMFNKRLGFTEEGLMRKAWPLGGDAVLFSMLKDECRWL